MGKLYVGVNTEFPVYETESVSITASNIGDYFTVTNGSYYFAGNGSTFTSNNKGVNNSTASTVLTAKYDITDLSFAYSYSSEASYDKFTLIVNGTTVENAVSGSTTTKTYTLERLSAGKTIEFKYVKDSSQHKNNDECTFSDMTFNRATQTGTTWQEVARRVKKMYVGIGGVARKIRKMYVGVNGVARKVFGGDLKSYGALDNLSYPHMLSMSAPNSKYIVFGGGLTGSSGTSTSNNVFAYDKDLSRIMPTTLSYPVAYGASTSIGDYSMIGGGSSYTASSSVSYRGAVNIYDSSLTKTYKNLSVAKTDLSAGSVDSYAIFAGGGNSSTKYSTVEAFDESLTKSNGPNLTVATIHMSTATLNNYAIFAGGSTSSGDTNKVFSYDNSLTVTDLPDMSRSTYSIYNKSATVGNYAMFYPDTSSIEIYDSSFTKVSASVSSIYRSMLAGASIENEYAVFAGGYYPGRSSSPQSNVYAFDESLTMTTPFNLTTARYYYGVGCCDNRMILLGGSNGASSNNVLSSVEVIEYD